jgi:hypothetical protein
VDEHEQHKLGPNNCVLLTPSCLKVFEDAQDVQTLQAEEWARFIYYQSVIFLFFASAWALYGERERKQGYALASLCGFCQKY